MTELARNLFGLLDRARPERVAFECDGETLTAGALRERALQLAAGLAAHGVRPGGRVAVLLSNRLEWPELLFALSALGAVCVPVNVLLQAPEVDHVLDDSGAEALVADASAAAVVEALAATPRLLVLVGTRETPPGAHAVAYESLFEHGRLGTAGPDLDATAMLYYTSGTTGAPKAAEHTHGGILWNALTQLLDLGLGEDDVYLCVASLSWAAGFHDLVLPLVWNGGRSVLLPGRGMTIERIVDATARSDVTHAFLVPTLLKQLLAEPDALARLRSTPLRWIVSGGEPVPTAVLETLAEELPGCRVVQGYGLSEFPTIATVLRPEEARTRAASAGRPLSIVTLGVRGRDDTIAFRGEGEVLIRSLATMRGYYRRPAETREAFRDGWLHTGDLGVVDEEGFLTITGRKKDMIISGGLNVYPKEIEEVLHRLPGIAEVAVVGVPDERWGEVPAAVVVPSREGVTAAAIDEACRARLAGFKRPKHVLLREEPLPRTPSGKILKRELRPWAAERVAEPEPADDAQAAPR